MKTPRFLAGALLVLLASCSAPEPPADLLPLPTLGTEGMESIAREQIEIAQEAIDRRLGQGDRRELADAYGSLGEILHAYRAFASAAVAYENAVRLDEESFVWPYYLGIVQAEDGRFEAAGASFEQALDLRPDHALARLRLARVRLEENRPEEAIQLLESLLDAEELAAAVQSELGRTYLALNQPDRAVAHLEAALSHQPEAGTLRHRLGLAYRAAGRTDEARALLEAEPSGEVTVPDSLIERIETLAVSSGALLRRGNQRLMAGDLEAAADSFRRAAEANPENVEAGRNLAVVRLRQDRPDDAVRALEAGLEHDPENAWLHHDLGVAHRAAERPQEAARSFRRAVDIAPDFVDAHFALANTLAGQEDWSGALPVLERVLELDPTENRARYLQGMCLHHLGRRREAVAELEALVGDSPNDLTYRQGLATALSEAGRGVEAMALYEQTLLMLDNPTPRADLLSQMAELAWRLRRRDDAIAFYRQAAKATPSSSRVRTNLANVLQLVGRQDEAIAEFARATELDPANATAWLSEATLWILKEEYRQALDRLDLALAAVADDAGLLGTTARLLATAPSGEVRDGRRAADLARKAYALEPSLETGETLGMAFAEMGRFEEAVRWQRSLIQQAAQAGETARLRQLTVHLRLYEAGRPVRIGN